MDIKVGDDITISGKVIEASKERVKVETLHQNHYLIWVEDVKTWRPNGPEVDDLK